jgi:predicted AAA+ superfamily ATPase
LRPLRYFGDYLRVGYYPFYREGQEEYLSQLQAVLNLIVETDLPAATNVQFSTTIKLKRLLRIIAEAVPFKPNVSKLSQQIGVTRDTLLTYLFWLEQAGLLNLLRSATHGVSGMGKPDKIYLNNPNLMYALTDPTPDIGNVRETFFYNQVLSAGYDVQTTQPGDFKVQDAVFEVGGKNKKRRQIRGIENSYVVADDIEIGVDRKIPLWLWGMLY